jgi:short-subunit dehydrogenase
MEKNNKGPKRAIIIGATSGIGLEVTKILTEQGWIVGIAGRRQELLQQIQSKNLNVIATQCIDITKDNATKELETLIGKLGGMDLYFHSSGIGYQNPSLDTEKELATVQTNALGFTRMIDFVFKYFVEHTEQKGHIAVISSIAGTKGLGAAPAYSSTKRYINHYLECLTQLCTIRGIKNIVISDIRPGFVRTPLLADGGKYPMQLDVKDVAKQIVKGLESKKAIITVDWKYRLLVFFWKHIPRWIWVRMKIASK